MGTTLQLVYKYRQLVGRCDAGFGLDFDDIDALTTIEALFGPADPHSGQLTTERVSFPAMVRNRSLGDRVTVVSLGPTLCICRQAPYAEVGDTLELVIDDPDDSLSYRFMSRVSWLRDDVHDDFTLGLELIGVPLLVHYGVSGDARVAAVPIAA